MNEFSNKSYEDLVSYLEQIAQEITNRLKEIEERNEKPARAAFPRGYIRTIDSLCSRWPYLSSDRQRIVACMIQLCDVNKWILNVWDIGLTAGYCLEWLFTIPVIAVCELLILQFCRQQNWYKNNQRVKFSKAIDRIHSEGVIDDKLRKALHLLRKYRDEIHLELKRKVGLYRGKPINYNVAVVILRCLEKSIMNYWDKNNSS
ncbi:MAG: hypothetical protein ACTSYD_04215 [Candidatus Heimdallarchaeaceae archaeon]